MKQTIEQNAFSRDYLNASLSSHNEDNSKHLGANRDTYVPNSAHNTAVTDIDLSTCCNSRQDLLRTSILLATSKSTEAQQNIINVISQKLGKIKEKDYKFIADLVLANGRISTSQLHSFLCDHIEGYQKLHKKLYKEYYGY